MKNNNYKQLSEPSILKRSASHALRSSFRLPKKRHSSQLHALNIEQLPSFIPPKAAAILQINVNTTNISNPPKMSHVEPPQIKVATIRKRSVWANAAAKISLPTSHQHERDDDNDVDIEVIKGEEISSNMHIGGFNFLQQNKGAVESATAIDVVGAVGILKEFNKNTSSSSSSSDNYKVNKKYKFGHINKSFEPSSAYALFECVEENQYDQLKNLLEQKQLNVNALNNDGFSVLDLAVLINNRAIMKLLLQHDAQTGNFPVENIESHLNTLLTDAEKKLAQVVTNASSSSQSYVGLETERKKLAIEKRIKLIRKMLNGWHRLKLPDPPFAFSIDVIGTNSVLLKILEPIVDETICTTFKVQYSPREDFSIIIAEKTITEWNIFQGTMGVNFHLDNLIQRRRYYFRACSGNLKGFGSYKVANPSSIVPSSWKDVEEKPRDSNFLNQRDIFENINKSIQQTKVEEPIDDRRNQKKKSTTIKQLFTTVSKFQKSLRRGIHLACIIFSDEKVLVTNEDFIPVIEIDDSYPNNLNNDFYWLMKISTSWEDVKNLRIEMEKNNSTNKIQFRFKILNAIHQMQMSLGITDLGQFYYKPLKDSNGTIVLCCSLYMKDLKTSTLHTKWVSMSKLQKKVTVLLDDSPINEILLNSIQSQINYYQASKIKLSRGLYLGYLKMFSSMDTIQIISQAKTPNVLPNCKIRDNPHISAEEWTVLKSNLERDKEGKLSQAQENFIESLKLSLNRLFKFMNVDTDDALLHRIYNVNVIELNEDVSFLIVCPPSCDKIISKDSSSCDNKNVDLSLKRSDLISVPLIVHEMIQFNTYQHNLLQKYARLSFLTEFDMITANLKQREAFSTNELQEAKDRLKHSEETMSNLNAAWKSIRWMMDVITFYRSKDAIDKLDIRKILQFVSTYNIFFKMPDPQLRGFHVKSPIRGSWAGPQTFKGSGSEILMYGTEHSKSEQLLNSIETHVPTTTTNTPIETIRKASIDSNYYSAGEQNDLFSIPRLPTSKSEDTLVVTRKKGPSNLHQRKRPTTVNPMGFEVPSSSSGSSKSNGLVVHRVNTQQNELQSSESSSKSSNEQSPSKSKLRVSHHPKTSNANPQQQQKKEIKKYHAEEESTLVTFLKPTLTAIQNESHNRSFKDPLIIVEDEAIEMISSPFSKTPVERTTKSNCKQQQLFGKSNQQFFRSSVHSKNVHAICQDTETQSADWRAFDSFKQIEESSETSAHNASQSFKSDIQSQIEEMLMERDYVNQSSIDSCNNNTSSSILQIYAAYDTGLASGTSLKLKCTHKTTAKDLIDLVVKQLNMAVVLKGKDGPVYGAEQLEDFCLVAVIGARERCLRDDFKPLELQNPWKKGKLFVRFKHDLLAAIEINANNREAFSL